MTKIDLKNLMKQAHMMQETMKRKQEELATKTFEASAGGGMVTAKVNGKREILDVTIDPAIIASNDVAMVQDLVVAAINEAFRQANDAMNEDLSGMLGGMGNIPGLGNLL